MQTELESREKSVVASEFGAEAEAWERHYRTGRADTVSRQNILTRVSIVEEMLGNGPGVLLDVGSAAGAASEAFNDRGWDVTGIDISQGMVDYATRRAAERGRSGVRYQVADAENLSFPDKHFDAVVAMGIIEYCPDEQRALDEMVRVLKPGGRFIITVPNVLSPFRRFDALLLAIERPLIPVLRRLRYGADGAAARAKLDRPRLNHREYTLGEIVGYLEKRGVRIERRAGHSWGSYRLDPMLPVGAALTRMARGVSDLPVLRSFGMSLVVSGRLQPR